MSNSNRMILIACATAMISSAALAQSDTTDGRVVLDEIVVTAQKRSENLQDVPLTVTALDGEALIRSGVSNVGEIGQVDANVQLQLQAGVVIPTLRGIGNAASQTAGNESSVSVYVDDVYYTRLNSVLLELANVDRIETLNGPQGTLFGRNASGGLVHVFTRAPSRTDRVLDATVGYGNYETMSGKLYASTPITDAAAADISVVAYDQRDGWGENLTTGKDTYTDELVSVRSKLVWDLSESTRLRLIGYYGKQKNTRASVVGGIYTGTRGLPPTYTTQYIPPDGFYDLATDAPQFNDNENYGGSIRLDQELNFADFTSISAFRRGDEEYASEGDQTNVNWLDYLISIYDRQISQEFQLKSKEGSSVDWIVGTFYLNSKQGFVPTRITGGAITANGLDAQRIYGEQTVNSYAVFSQATIPVIDDRNRVTLGVRYTEDHVDGEGRTTITLTGGPTVPFGPEYMPKVVKFDKITYKGAFDHRFTDDVLAYASISRGYKSGTYNTLPLDAPPTKPEVVDAYEIGVKSELFDNRMRLNASAFWNDIKSPQVQLIKNVGGIASAQFANAGKARTKGVNLETTTVVTQQLTFLLSAQYLDAKYRDFQDAPINTPIFVPPFGITTAPGDASGNDMPSAPEWKVTSGVNFDIPTSVGSFSLDANVSYRTSFKWDPDNLLTEPSLTLINAGLTFSPAFNDALSVRLWGKNLGDEKYINSQQPQTGPVGYMQIVAAPRTYGVELRAKF